MSLLKYSQDNIWFFQACHFPLTRKVRCFLQGPGTERTLPPNSSPFGIIRKRFRKRCSLFPHSNFWIAQSRCIFFTMCASACVWIRCQLLCRFWGTPNCVCIPMSLLDAFSNNPLKVRAGILIVPKLLIRERSVRRSSRGNYVFPPQVYFQGLWCANCSINSK